MKSVLIKTVSIHLNIQIFGPTENPGKVFLENEPEGTPFLLLRSIERELMHASMVLR